MTLSGLLRQWYLSSVEGLWADLMIINGTFFPGNQSNVKLTFTGPSLLQVDQRPHSQGHPRRRTVTTSIVGFNNGHIRKNLTQNGKP